MIGEDQVRAIAEKEAPADVHARFLQIFEFGYERRRIDHGAGADDGLLLRAQNAAGNKLQDVAMAIEDDRVAGIVAAGVARGVIEGRGQIVDDLPFAFVAPLGADYRDRLRPNLLHHFPHPVTTRITSALLSLLHVKHCRRAFAATTETSSYAAGVLKARAGLGGGSRNTHDTKCSRGRRSSDDELRPRIGA